MMTIRRATEHDAAGIRVVWEEVTAQRMNSAVVKPWTVEQEAAYLRGLSDREAVHVAVTPDGEVVGFQSLDLWTAVLTTMAHVGSLGTFVLASQRR